MTQHATQPDSDNLLDRIPVIPHALARRMLCRYGVYSAVIIVLLLTKKGSAHRLGIEAFVEGGLIETLQIVVIGLVAALFLIASYCIREMRSLYGVLGMMAALATIRELDFFFDDRLPWGWKGPALLCLFGALCFALRHPARFDQQVALMLQSPAFGVLWVGLMLMIAFAQLVGHGPFLETMLGDAFNRDLKRVVEELLELFAYGIIFFGSIELLFYFQTGCSVRIPVEQ